MQIKKSLKPVLFSLGILVGLGAVELSLRLTGVFYLRTRKDHVRLLTGATVILCMGDSHTAGLGAPAGKDYPHQLQELLEVSDPNKKFVVINRGTPGFNTAKVLHNLPVYLEQFQPQILLLLVGMNNDWNYWGYHDYLHRKKLVSRLQNFFLSLRLYKLMALIKIAPHNTGRNRFSAKRASAHPVATGAENTSLTDLAYDLFARGDHEEAILTFEKARSFHPGDWRIYNGLGRIYRDLHQYDRAIETFKRGIEIDLFREDNYSGLSLVYKDLSQYEEAALFFEKQAREYPLARSYAEIFRKKEALSREINLWIEHDLTEIVKICQKRKIRLIIQSYPTYPLKKEIFERVCSRFAIPYIDHNREFQRLFETGAKREEYFNPGYAHCNEKGYARMAENIFNKLNTLQPLIRPG